MTMLIELLIVLTAFGVYFSRPSPWDVVLKVLVALLILLWFVRTLAPTLV